MSQSKPYVKYMVLKLFVDDGLENSELKQKYIEASQKHNDMVISNPFVDAGFDLFTPSSSNDICFRANEVNKVDFKVKCSAKIFTESDKIYNTGFYMYPRSSLSKTKLRLANSVGIIDAGYRGNLMSMFDVVNNGGEDYWGNKYDRYIQICAPSLMPIVIEVVSSVAELGNDTSRGAGAFGSTGK
jgi:dUTP pyrophosphatase